MNKSFVTPAYFILDQDQYALRKMRYAVSSEVQKKSKDSPSNCSFHSHHDTYFNVCSQLIYIVLQVKKEKKRFGYTFKKNAEVDAADLQLYEPVERVPPFSRKTLVIIINHSMHSLMCHFIQGNWAQLSVYQRN